MQVFEKFQKLFYLNNEFKKNNNPNMLIAQ